MMVAAAPLGPVVLLIRALVLTGQTHGKGTEVSHTCHMFLPVNSLVNSPIHKTCMTRTMHPCGIYVSIMKEKIKSPTLDSCRGREAWWALMIHKHSPLDLMQHNFI